MRTNALFCAVLIVVFAEHLMGSDLLIWGVNRDGAVTNLVIHVPQTKDEGVACVKLCPTGLNQFSIEKLGAIIVNSDQTVVAVGHVSSDLVPPTGLKNVVDVAVGFNHAIALTREGSVIVWGEGFFATNKVPDELSNVVGVAADMRTCSALSSNGTIVSWGSWGIDRQWKGASQVTAISLSQDFFSRNAVALKRDGTLLQWHRQTMASPVAGISNVVAISVSPSHCLALTRDSTAISWDSNSGGQTSILPGLTNVIAIAVGFEYVGAEAATGFSLALRKDGTLVGRGQMGRYKSGIVPPGLSNVVAIAAGDGFCMAITTNRVVAERFQQKP